MPYIILLILVIAIVVVAVRQQKFNHKTAQQNAEMTKEQEKRNFEKENSIEVNDYEVITDNTDSNNQTF